VANELTSGDVVTRTVTRNMATTVKPAPGQTSGHRSESIRRV
jgi:hypothetical protein